MKYIGISKDFFTPPRKIGYEGIFHMAPPVPNVYTQYAETADDPSFSKWLRAQAEPTWSEMQDHRFVHEMTTDDIDDVILRDFMLQEYSFVDKMAALVGTAISKAPSMAERQHLTETIEGLTKTRPPYFRKLFEEFDIPEEEWSDPELYPLTEQFHDLLYRAGSDGEFVETLVPMLAAEWLYATWTTEAAERADTDTHTGEWIHVHLSDEYQGHVTWLQDQLDTYGPTLPAYRERRIANIFRRTIEMEIAFHNAPYAHNEEA